jgi:hypothetical protein
VQELLGHASISTTQVYTQARLPAPGQGVRRGASAREATDLSAAPTVETARVTPEARGAPGTMPPMKSIRLHAGRERALLRGHPWVFESSIARGRADAGETVRVEAHDGRFLAWGAFSPASAIRVRAWSFDEAERIERGFFERRVAQALALRARLPIASDGVRLVHGESDGLPGLVVDRYGDTLVAQFGAAGVERWKPVLADALLAATGCARLYERSDASVRGLEGLPEATGWLRGDGDTALAIREHGWQLTLDVASGHKTGYYLDQRDNRALFADWVRQPGLPRVLNCLLLHRRLHGGGAGRRRRAGAERRLVGTGARTRAGARGAERLRRGAQRGGRCRRQCAAARAAAGWRALRRHRARPAEVRAHRARTPSAPRAPTRTSTGWR